jgi:hypothetical protein
LNLSLPGRFVAFARVSLLGPAALRYAGTSLIKHAERCLPCGVHRDEHDSPKPGVVGFYNRRGTAEQWIKEGKQAVKITLES